jgi:hypothetical protein
MNKQNDHLEFYTKLFRETAEGIQKNVCGKCNISLTPKNASELGPIPVYEEGYTFSLLDSAKIQCPTEIRWATNNAYEYLPAYFKRYKLEDGSRCNEIVVTAGNYCIARFFAAKELMHCFIDVDGYPQTNSIPLVNDLIEDLTVGIKSLNSYSNPQTIVDELAWVGASLYLIPDGWIPLLNKVLLAIAEKEPNANAFLHVSQLIRVPELVLRARLRHSAPQKI